MLHRGVRGSTKPRTRTRGKVQQRSSNDRVPVLVSAWVQVQVLVTPRSLQSRIVSKHCRCVRCILVIAKGSGIVSRGQERRYSRGRSLDGIHDADRLMQRENAKLVIDVDSPIRFGLFSLSLFLPTRIDSALRWNNIVKIRN